MLTGIGMYPNAVWANKEPDGEALLLFSYPALGQEYVNVVFFDEVPFLPLAEVLSLLNIAYDRSENGKGLQGTYPTKNESWLLDPIGGRAVVKGEMGTLSVEQFYLGETDLYIHPEFFNRIFGLKFSVNFHTLTLGLETNGPLPIDERQKRELMRKRLQQSRTASTREPAPLLYDRQRKVFAPGMVDYNLNYTYSDQGQSMSMLVNAGMEILGGDFQGLFSGNVYNKNFISRISNARWRYVFNGGLLPDDNVPITSFTVGQIQTTGLNNSARILGVALSNNPVIPRMKLDVFTIDGYTEPDSEVELLIGGQLIDFVRADEVGYYRFNAPITFGVVRLMIRIYTPQGEVIVQEKQMQIPFTFLPKGFVTYNFQMGLPILDQDSLGTETVSHADFAYGLTNAVTVRAGVDNGSIFGERETYGVFGLSARIMDQYLLNVDVLPDRYYQASASVFYANNTSINAQFTEFVAGSEFNYLNQIREANLNAFIPFKTFRKFSGFRITGERQWFENGFRTNFQTDFNTQIGRLITRINYRGRISGFEEGAQIGDIPAFLTNPMGQLTGSVTYTLMRNPNIPVFVRGMFIRGQYRYDTYLKKPISYNFMLSQTLFKMGRLTIGYDKDMLAGKGQFQIGFLYDFKGLRTSTAFTGSSESYAAQQGFTGSLGLDPRGFIVPENRDQVTRSGLAVRLFIDANENGTYDFGEVVVPAKAVRLDRSVNMLLGSDGILRITQLQSYWKYIMEVDTQALPDPNLAPRVSRFEIVAEPNRFKNIDIPLYQTGLVEGTVSVEQFGKEEGKAGLRLILERQDNSGEELQILRTFSDGGFYQFGLMPGKYKLFIDPTQIEFMHVDVYPQFREFEIRALAEGDYLENLNFLLKPKEDKPEDE
ncbi:hypothetical protein SAMN00777080_3984 [Aquiflexum balticum DSM 16537]|uniref:Carboxypeptidase regulatory-like domain-containing protein n=1 Tax=Aquiflexum balticum DSM 16537 TaxID=758820 RepID=A0A1W2H8X5_9BACT|nr:hypothetical protein [Aquiflexum balticum]SMD45335.1 hypothetical protein SAMN00777080_3984 [Aquiflexum balticum DSM 16537]